MTQDIESDKPTNAQYFPPLQQPQIILRWLTRLRWLAIAGQLLATLVAYRFGAQPPIAPLLVVVGITAITNVGLWRWVRAHALDERVVLTVLLVDVVFLTLLLYCTGGTRNPFSILYLIHVAMAVAMLGETAVWIVVAVGVACYTLLLVIPPLQPLLIDAKVLNVGHWTSFALVAVLIAYFTGRVIGEVRLREQQLAELQEKAAQHDRLATLTALSAGAAHELGTPLATIAVVAKELQLAVSQIPGADDIVEDAKLIRQECNRCRFILDRMRVEVVDDTREFATPLASFMKVLYERLSDADQARLTITGPTTGHTIAASSAAMEQAVVVLVRNAVDASPGETMVNMKIKTTPEMIAFEVTDQGHGMPPDVLKKAGDPFFTTKGPGRGMGLGLFLVRLVADRYGGKLDIVSTPGKGTKVSLILPLVTPTVMAKKK